VGKGSIRRGSEAFDVTLPDGHAAWLVASKAGLPPERVTVWAGRDR
jgi:hypothetical protein